MKRIVWMIVLGGALLFGGKNVVPAGSPVTPVEEGNGWYLGAGFTGAKLSCNEGNCPYEDTTYGLMVRGGYDFNNYLGIEVRGLRTFWDKAAFGGAPLQHVGLFLKPMYLMGENVLIYGLLGYGKTWNKGNGNRLNYFDSDTGFSAGVGLEYSLKKRHSSRARGWAVFVDYQRLLIKGGAPKLGAFSIGIVRHF